MEKMMNVKRRRKTRSFGIDDESSNGLIHERRCWSDLPSDLMEPIMSKLFFADQINFLAVCKSWHSFDRDRVPPPLKQMPWLMVFDDKEGNHSWDSCKLVDPTYKKTYTIDMSFVNKKNLMDSSRIQIHESKYGWLLMSSSSSCISINQNNPTPTSSSSTTTHSLFLYSPFIIDNNNNIIELPVLSASDTRQYIATFDLILNPSKNKNQKVEGFEVLVLSSDTNQTICIKTCRQGDNSWSCNKTIWKFYLSIIKCWVYSEGIFYYMTSPGNNSGTYDIARNNWTKFPALVPVQTLRDLKMIKFDGEIYLISVNKNGQRRGSMCVYIYKFDLSKRTWESIHNLLDDRVLFVGDEYSSILELDNDVEELKDQRQKVYYCYSKYREVVKGWDYGYYTTMLKYCNALNGNKSYVCSKWYGSLAQGNQDCKRLWIDPPRHIRNSI